jgi:hypothetical protein
LVHFCRFWYHVHTKKNRATLIDTAAGLFLSGSYVRRKTNFQWVQMVKQCLSKTCLFCSQGPILQSWVNFTTPTQFTTQLVEYRVF